jgi:hypothetical protein
MNERIRELKQQSIDYVDSIDDGLKLDHYKELVDQKFAELIVRECIRVPYDMWDKAELNADVAVKIEHRIKEHFGVEE